MPKRGCDVRRVTKLFLTLLTFRPSIQEITPIAGGCRAFFAHCATIPLYAQPRGANDKPVPNHCRNAIPRLRPDATRGLRKPVQPELVRTYTRRVLVDEFDCLRPTRDRHRHPLVFELRVRLLQAFPRLNSFFGRLLPFGHCSTMLGVCRAR